MIRLVASDGTVTHAGGHISASHPWRSPTGRPKADSLTYSIVTWPTSMEPLSAGDRRTKVIYTPAAQLQWPGHLQIQGPGTASDDSNVATISVTVNPVDEQLPFPHQSGADRNQLYRRGDLLAACRHRSREMIRLTYSVVGLPAGLSVTNPQNRADQRHGAGYVQQNFIT